MVKVRRMSCVVSIHLYSTAVHTNQKRFQCERPREKRTVLIERKEALLTSPVNKVDCVDSRRRELDGSEATLALHILTLTGCVLCLIVVLRGILYTGIVHPANRHIHPPGWGDTISQNTGFPHSKEPVRPIADV